MSMMPWVIGVGSPHGDDQIGWLIADALVERQSAHVTVRKAASPSEVLNWIDDVRWLGLCDGCRGAGAAGEWYCWTWPDLQIEQHHFGGTHGMTLAEVLKLAVTLGRAPATIKIWGIEIGDCQPGAATTEKIRECIPQIVDSILHEIGHISGNDYA